jgi:hypothetical protein
VKARELLVMCALAGCTAQMVSPARSSSSSYAPTNEASRHGLVKYFSDGAGFVVKKRRENAYKQMFENCGGPYRIVAEGQRVEGGVVVSTTTASGQATVADRGKTTDIKAEAQASTETMSAELHYWYIQYECQNPKPDAKSPS